MRPVFIPAYILKHLRTDHSDMSEIIQMKERIERLDNGQPPLVSIVIPAYNEQNNILRTLSSLSYTETSYPVEIIIVDNNSTDDTRMYVKKSGARYVFEAEKGVKNARTAGLKAARGTYIISGDADTVYPPYWVDMLVTPLMRHHHIACVHGKFSFIPEDGYTRASFFLYEIIGDCYKWLNSLFKDPAMYVYGCSSAFRKSQALEVGAYDHPAGANEDGYLGLKLRNKFGKLAQVSQKKSLAWTSSRKFVAEGTLVNRILKKTQRMFN